MRYESEAMTELSAKLAAGIRLTFAARWLLRNLSANHICRFFITRLSSLPASPNLLKLLSVWMCQHGCSVPQSVRGEALTVGVVVSERGEEVGK
tara:strand:+ start:8034 stop:8315 length:282 start_codon:yes stop_codon:yes gene_type:complete